MSFKDLKVAELRRAAIEDFAVEIDEKANADEIRATFVEMGITWDAYLDQHPELKPVVEEPVAVVPAPQFDPNERVREPARPGAVVTSGDVTGGNTEPVPTIIRVKEAPVLSPNEQYLVKMTRPNTLFETRGHRFTAENPYALVNAEDFEYILEKEDGFRQAYPSELNEFYG